MKGVLSNLDSIYLCSLYWYRSYRKDVILLHRKYMMRNQGKEDLVVVDTFIYLLCTLSITTKKYSASEISKKEKVLTNIMDCTDSLL